ncbi:MAG: TetR/AcrR family transcriptional regulator [Elusimicrobia bacterium]|jgi:AcrR family transcriptional regulator|nr:TetR/AcrR family transcriptional regulator [Elusimicrobiota bacterium]
MTRPSKDIDQKLIVAARALVADKGFGALTVRAAAARARVNPGMFHYHFRTKRVFKRRILESIYEDFFERFTQSAKGVSPLDKLRESLRYVGRFSRDHRREGFTLIQDALSGDQDTVEFMGTHFLRHMKILMGLAADAQKAGQLDPAPLPFVMTFIMAGVGLPHILLESFKSVKVRHPYGFPFSEVEEALLTDEAIDQRVQAVLRGLGASA